MQTDTLTTPAPTVPEIPAEALENIPTAPKRLAEAKLDRRPSNSGSTRKGRASVAPRAWTMGGNVD